jgi:alkylhydroperoxidase family enzyme
VDEDLARAALDGRADDSGFTPRERAALLFADQFWHDHHAVSDELWAQMRDVFSPSEIVELSLSVAANIAMGKVMAMLRIPNPNYRDHLPLAAE